jgi:hybrid polyketide synthase/nonribosomal peptide synthetase ACE1
MSKYVHEPIAVVGSACRFPGGASSPSKLWELLEKPRDVLRPIDRFKAESHYHPDGHHHGTSNVLAAYLLDDDTRTFDPQFFNIQANEAESIDPQQRVLLETVYEGIESAGMTIEGLQNTATAVYVGCMCDDYNAIAYNDGEAVPKYAATGTARSIMSNRVSYFFNWNGPSMTIDTACSSSLVAVHQAVQVLRSGESNVAVAAGTNLILSTRKHFFCCAAPFTLLILSFRNVRCREQPQYVGSRQPISHVGCRSYGLRSW